MKIFPWEFDKEPYFINEKGVHWYVDEALTKYCTNERVNNLTPLKAVVFFLAEMKDGELQPLTRVLMDIKSNEILCEDGNLESMSIRIDMLRFVNTK